MSSWQSVAANVSGAALGDNEKGIYAIHLVNNGSTRTATITGLPSGVRSLRLLVTDRKRSMKAGTSIPVTNGKARFILDATSFATLTGRII